ncbi:MAG TPA: hypothetical protein ENI87_13645 [bacterium]|nr:hypothetical protein [bacterium]
MSSPPAGARLRPPRRWGAVCALTLLWLLAAIPVLLFALHQRDPELAVRVALGIETWSTRAGLMAAGGALLAALLYPPFPAWLRRFAARTRTSWSVDRAPLLRALRELQHLETAQRHYEVARLAWIRGDLSLVGPHIARAVELDPQMARGQYQLGLYLLRIGALPPAHAAFAAAERLDPGHAFGAALLHAARTADLLGKHDLALELFARHAARHGTSPRSDHWHGEALLAAGQTDAARRAFENAARDPKSRLSAEENWFRALARVRARRLGGRS